VARTGAKVLVSCINDPIAIRIVRQTSANDCAPSAILGRSLSH